MGFARRDWADQDFAQIVHDSVREHARTEFREEVWRQLAEGFRFVPGGLLRRRRLRTGSAARSRSSTRCVGRREPHAFYLSIPPRFFGEVVQQLQEHGLTEDRRGAGGGWWSRSRSGHDLESARASTRSWPRCFERVGLPH
ncbi:MAG: hypothetical protein R2731_03990 [Nocardioides sp.]